MTTTASTAVIDKTAQLGEDVVVGPGCVIGAGVEIGDGCELKANVIVAEGTRIGKNNRIFAGCVLGEEPQSLGLVEPETELIIGDNNTLREYVTIHRGSPDGGGKTIVGNNNFMMVGSHLGHDCLVEDNVVMTNYCQVSGHCKIETKAWISGHSALHQFVTIGRLAYVAGLSGVTHDIPPFMRAAGSYPCEVRGLNAVGLRRAGGSEESIEALSKVYRRLYGKRRDKNIVTTVEEMLANDGLDENVKYLLESLQRSFQHRMRRYLETLRH